MAIPLIALKVFFGAVFMAEVVFKGSKLVSVNMEEYILTSSI